MSTNDELQPKAVALRRAGILDREIHKAREKGKSFLLFVVCAFRLIRG
jgi:hypothetical protein